MENEIINIDSFGVTDNKEEEFEKDLLLRQSKLLYPDVENWILNMAIEAYQNEVKIQNDIIENVNTKIHF
tara:strand:- start:453 stop:662 length:210 start_codon:yes stop_codon:yes gene_type:complete